MEVVVVVWAGPALAAGLLPHHLRARRSHPSWRGHGGGPDLSRRRLLRTLPLHGGDMRGTRDSGRCAATTAILAAPDGPRVGNPRRRWHRSSRKGPAAAAAVPSADPPCAAHATPDAPPRLPPSPPLPKARARLARRPGSAAGTGAAAQGEGLLRQRGAAVARPSPPPPYPAAAALSHPSPPSPPLLFPTLPSARQVAASASSSGGTKRHSSPLTPRSPDGGAAEAGWRGCAASRAVACHGRADYIGSPGARPLLQPLRRGIPC